MSTLFDNPNVPINQALADLVAGESATGQLVTAQSVMGIPAVYRGVKLISGKVARLPVHIYKRANGLNIIDENHPAEWLLQRPNQHYGKYTLFSVLTHNSLLLGNGYALIERDGNGVAESLSILDSSVTFPLLVDGDLAYKTEINGQKIILSNDAVLHIKNLSNDGYLGISVIEVLRETLGLSQSLIRYGATFFRNFSMLGHVIELPGYLDDEAVAKFRAGWGEFHKGLSGKQARGLGLLQGGATLKPVTVNNSDVEFLESREFDIVMIANALGGVPPHKLGSHNRNASYNSLESENQAFLDDCIEDWLATWSEELEMKLLTEYQKNSAYSHFVDFDRSFLVKADIEQQHTIDMAELNNGCITLDEYNARKNRSPVGGEIGSVHRIPTNIGFMETIVAAQKQAEAQADTTTETELDQEQQPTATGEDAIPDDYQPQDAPLTDTAQVEMERKLNAMIAGEVRRIHTRIDKALETAIKKREEIDLEPHAKVFAEALSPVMDDSGTAAKLWLREYVKDQTLTAEQFIGRHIK